MVTQPEFNRGGLYSPKKYYETYCDDEFVTTLLTQISWSNHFAIMSKAKPQRRDIFIWRFVSKKNYHFIRKDKGI